MQVGGVHPVAHLSDIATDQRKQAPIGADQEQRQFARLATWIDTGTAAESGPVAADDRPYLTLR